MLFKLGKFNLEISFTFLGVLLIILLNKPLHFFGVTLVCALLHECVHIFFLLLFGCPIEKVRLTIFGGDIVRGKGRTSTPIKEAVIHLSAPVFNIAVGVFLFFCNRQSLWGASSLLVGLFNIAPFYNLDGGAGLYYLLVCFLENRVAENTVTFTSAVVVVVFSAFNAFVSFYQGVNPFYILINMYFFVLLLYRLFRKRCKFE